MLLPVVWYVLEPKKVYVLDDFFFNTKTINEGHSISVESTTAYWRSYQEDLKQL